MRNRDQRAEQEAGGWDLLNIDEVINRLLMASRSKTGRYVITALCLLGVALVAVLPLTWRNQSSAGNADGPAVVTVPEPIGARVPGVEPTTTLPKTPTTTSEVEGRIGPVLT